jgi:hypothetical protein
LTPRNHRMSTHDQDIEMFQEEATPTGKPFYFYG